MIKMPNILTNTLEGFFGEREKARKEKFYDWYSKLTYAPAIEFGKQRRIAACLDELLARERSRLKEKREENQIRWNAASAVKQSVDKALENFDSYYRESLQKRARAIKEATKQKDTMLEKEIEISKLEKERIFLGQLLEHVTRRYNRFKVFEEYLERVVESSLGEYSDVREIIDRYATLEGVREVLAERNRIAFESLEKNRRMYKTVVERKSTELVLLSNYLAELGIYQEDLLNEMNLLEEKLVHIKTTAATRTIMLGQIKTATYNLYMSLCKQMKRPPFIDSEDTIRQLLYIRQTMKDMIRLVKEVRHMIRVLLSSLAKAEKERNRQEQLKAVKQRLGRNKVNKTDIRVIFGLSPRSKREPVNETQITQPPKSLAKKNTSGSVNTMSVLSLSKSKAK